MVPAWRSYAYRVPKKIFESILIKDESLSEYIERIDAKNTILNFQHQQIDIYKNQLSHLLQKSLMKTSFTN
jgi:predicted nucleic acid-binding protein